jgi:hypothetical protein
MDEIDTPLLQKDKDVDTIPTSTKLYEIVSRWIPFGISMFV